MNARDVLLRLTLLVALSAFGCTTPPGAGSAGLVSDDLPSDAGDEDAADVSDTTLDSDGDTRDATVDAGDAADSDADTTEDTDARVDANDSSEDADGADAPDTTEDPPIDPRDDSNDEGELDWPDEVDPFCGDGVVDEGEECDEGSANSDVLADACRTDCVSASCGDAVIDTGEECDGPPTAFCSDFGYDYGGVACVACENDGSACTDEEIVVCGDGVVGTGETCDDGNATDGDGCTSLCLRCDDDAAEDDDTAEAAFSMTEGVEVERVLQAGDIDMFEMFLMPGCHIYLDAFFSEADGVLMLEVVNLDGTVISTAFDETDHARAVFAPSGFAGGNFFARARTDEAGACIPYRIVWNCSDPDT